MAENKVAFELVAPERLLAKLEADMRNPKWQQVIDANRALARTLGISGTPGFIVGTELVPGALDLNGLKELIARAGSRP